MPDPEKSKNIIFSPWGHQNIQNDVAQLVQTPEHLKCLFQPKYPWSTLVWLKVKQGQNPHKTTCFMVLYQTRAPRRASPNQKKKKKTFLGLAICLDVFYTFFFSRKKTHKKHIKTSWFFLLHQKYKVLFLYPIFFSLVLYLGFGV